jgi:hypothetical protein
MSDFWPASGTQIALKTPGLLKAGCFRFHPVMDFCMGLFDWLRGKSKAPGGSSLPPAGTSSGDSAPEVIPFPAPGMADSTQVCSSVRMTESALFAILPTGSELRLDLQDLYRVAVRTTDEGDWAPDVFWIVSAGAYTYLIPQGIPGEAELFNYLIKLPGFDKETMISAISSTENSEFECWRRD